MKNTVLFKTFNYAIVPAKEIAGLELTSKQPEDKQVPLVNIDIDFEQENFRLEGDWQYMMASNRHAEKNWFTCHHQRVSIEASIYPGISIDLSDDNNDGLVFIIEGTIRDQETTDSCSGLLVLDKRTGGNETTAGKWDISFYLYDIAHDNCEIAFRFPVHGRRPSDLLN